MKSTHNSNSSTDAPVALITGGARRIGAGIAEALHRRGYRLVIHYRSSADAVAALADRLNDARASSCTTIAADLVRDPLPPLVAEALDRFGRLDALINNASSFYPTPVGEIDQRDWLELMGSNAMAPLFLAQAAAAPLAERRGAIVNIVDIHAQRPLANHTVYGMAKAALAMLTRSLAVELAPEVRVNGVSPGAILWPETELSEANKAKLLARVPLARQGDVDDIAAAVCFLLTEAPYVTGQILAVDGGRSMV